MRACQRAYSLPNQTSTAITTAQGLRLISIYETGQSAAQLPRQLAAQLSKLRGRAYSEHNWTSSLVQPSLEPKD